jgi:hypothetical protein
MALNQLKYISRILNENLEYNRENFLYHQCCDSLHNLKSVEGAVSTLYKEIIQKEDEKFRRENEECECGGELIFNEDNIHYCQDCSHIFRDPPECFANYKNYRIKRNPRYYNRLQDNAFKNLYRLDLPLDLREKARDLYGDNEWDKAEMCKCLTKAAEELNY